MTAPGHDSAVEVHVDEIRRLIEEAEHRPLTKAECDQLLAVVLSYCRVGELLADKKASLANLRKLLFGSGSEKTADVVGAGKALAEMVGEALATAQTSTEGSDQKPPRKGHGRNGADAYRSAERTRIPHDAMKAGAKCPEAECKGILYKLAEPAVLVRVFGGPPLCAHVWELERLRCNLCGAIFTAKGPAGLGTAKYDATAASMIGVLRYGTGVPFHRLAQLETDLGVPLPVSTQWDIVAAACKKVEPAFDELVRQAAQGEILHNDDTKMRVLELQAELRAKAADEDSDDERVGVFTTGIVAKVGDRRIALYFTGGQHAGENLAELLQQRAADRSPPMQMCDGLSHNLPKDFETILGNCLAHGRRKFVEVYDFFPKPCRHVLEAFRQVYHHEKEAKLQGLTAKERLMFHQRHSGPVMEQLRQWLDAQITEKLVEPNGRLGKAIRYLQNRWAPLTLFLRQAGAPLDNNLCEQALKRAIIHRKNSLFYKTENGAKVGDAFMSLIHTAELCEANPFDYLTELQRHAADVAREPAAWMPWNYRAALGDPDLGLESEVASP